MSVFVTKKSFKRNCSSRSRKVKKNSRDESRKIHSAPIRPISQEEYILPRNCIFHLSEARGRWGSGHTTKSAYAAVLKSLQQAAARVKAVQANEPTPYFSTFNLPYELEGFVVWLKLDYLCWLECLNRGTVQFHGSILLF